MVDKFKGDIGRTEKSEQVTKKRIDDAITAAQKSLEERKKGLERVHSKEKADDHILRYWLKCRESHKRHYHLMLKMSHSGIMRLKNTMGMIDRALAGKLQ